MSQAPGLGIDDTVANLRHYMGSHEFNMKGNCIQPSGIPMPLA